MPRIPGLVLTDHVVDVPLDHAVRGGPRIEVFAREVVAPDKIDADLPWLLFLQGGPGGKAPRPTGASGWIGRAVQTHRVLLLDQRGTGRSTPLTAATLGEHTPAEQAAYIRNFRADSIVADAEVLRARLTGGRPWDTIGQSYGGFVTLCYLSRAPEGLRTCYVTGGIPGIAARAADVYARTYPRVAAKNAAYYARYPGDVDTVRRIADHLDHDDVRLPDGDRLTSRRFRLLGGAFGMSDGFERVHWIIDEAWHGDQLADPFLRQVMAMTCHAEGPMFALQEITYNQGADASGWAAEAELARHPEFAPDADPLLFTGEMMYPWMFREIRALQPFAEAADILAETADWPMLYDPDRLAANQVPLMAAVYFDDMYVDSALQLETLAAIGSSRAWVTNEHEHDGLKQRNGEVLGRLMDMAAGKC